MARWTAQDSRNTMDATRARWTQLSSAPNSAAVAAVISAALSDIMPRSQAGESSAAGYYGNDVGADSASVEEAARQLRQAGYRVTVGTGRAGGGGFLNISWGA